MSSSPAPRLCACGCARPIPADAHGKRLYASAACRQRGHRGRETQRARARRASVQAAVEHRGPLDLAALLDVAELEARRRPGTVLLRLAGRLVVLTADELAQLAQLARGLRACTAALGEAPEEISEKREATEVASNAGEMV